MAEPIVNGIQIAFEALLGVAGALGGLILKGLKDDQKDLERKYDALADLLPSVYARRDDVKEWRDEVKHSLERIEDRLGTRPH